MLELAWPWVLAAAPLPLVVAWLVPRARDAAGAALRVPFYRDVAPWASSGRARRHGARLALATLAWTLLVLAAARPVWVGDPVAEATTGRDLMLAIDLSASMRDEDMRVGNEWVSRVQVVKDVASEFVRRRRGDRVGLILFGSRAYLQAPLTLDLDTVGKMIDSAVLGLAGDQTAIGDAIGLAVKHLKDRPAENRVLVLLTDGADTASRVPPRQAAEFAKKAGVTIYAIGVGADDAVLQRWFGGRPVRPRSALDERSLKEIARITGGRYFRARDTAELSDIYHVIDRLEPVAGKAETVRPTRELFPWPLGAAWLIAALGAAWALLPGARARARARLGDALGG